MIPLFPARPSRRSELMLPTIFRTYTPAMMLNCPSSCEFHFSVYEDLLYNYDIMVYEIAFPHSELRPYRPLVFVVDHFYSSGDQHVRFFKFAQSTDKFDSEQGQIFLEHLWNDLGIEADWDPDTMEFSTDLDDDPIVFREIATIVIPRISRAISSDNRNVRHAVLHQLFSSSNLIVGDEDNVGR